MGGTVPFVHDFLAALDQPELVLVGVGDPHSNAHGVDESVAIDDLRRTAVAEALFLARLGETTTRQERE
jgi:acetylornithine deacetylase/succinyl-diaminopimelate desuccinylase-like protein